MKQNFKTIIYKREGNFARITLNRPEVRNAISIEMGVELNAALNQAKADENVRVVILRGAGSAFCAGMDLKWAHTATVLEYRKWMETLYWELTDIMCGLGKPTIAALNGPALAAGCTIAFSCDMIIASDKAYIGYPEINIGLLSAKHIILLPRIVGRLKAFELVITGEPLSVKEAERMGLVNKVVPHDKLEEVVDELASKVAAKSPLAVKLTKEAFYRGLDMEFRKAIADAGDIACVLFNFEDTREGMRSFVEKRAPVWKGR